MDYAICVAAIDNNYDVQVSSYGKPVQFLAPGRSILTTGIPNVMRINDRVPTATTTGTSLAAPHVAGVAAIFKSWKGRYGTNYDGLVQPMKDNALQGKCDKVPRDAQNTLINTGFGHAGKSDEEPFKNAGPWPFRRESLDDGDSESSNSGSFASWDQGPYVEPEGYEGSNGYEEPEGYEGSDVYEEPEGYEGSDVYEEPEEHEGSGNYGEPEVYDNLRPEIDDDDDGSGDGEVNGAERG